MRMAEKLYIILALFGIILQANGSITCDLQVSINGVTNNYPIIEASVGDSAVVTCSCSGANFEAYLTKINLKNYTITFLSDRENKTINETLLDPLSFTCCQNVQVYHCSRTRFLNVIQSEPVTSSSSIPSLSHCISPSSSTLANADSTYSSSIKSIISSVDISPSSSITSNNEQLVLTTANTAQTDVSTSILHTESSTIVQMSAPLTANTDASSILHTKVSPTVQADVPTTATDGRGVVTITEIMSSCPPVQTVTEFMSRSPPPMTTATPRGPEATASTFYECFNNSGFITFMAIFVLILIIQFLVCITVILCCRYRNKKMKFENDLTYQNNYQTQSADL